MQSYIDQHEVGLKGRDGIKRLRGCLGLATDD
jgi:hypothetical protein